MGSRSGKPRTSRRGSCAQRRIPGTSPRIATVAARSSRIITLAGLHGQCLSCSRLRLGAKGVILRVYRCTDHSLEPRWGCRAWGRGCCPDTQRVPCHAGVSYQAWLAASSAYAGSTATSSANGLDPARQEPTSAMVVSLRSSRRGRVLRQRRGAEGVRLSPNHRQEDGLRLIRRRPWLSHALPGVQVRIVIGPRSSLHPMPFIA